MDLFSPDPLTNLLPSDGEVHYLGRVLRPQQAEHYFQKLLESIEWKHDEAILWGKHFVTKRKVAWYGDQAYAYTYSNTTKHALPWTPELLELKGIVEAASNASFNSCLLNLYHNGDEGMTWHSDDEKSLQANGVIASLSLGAARRFAFKHKRSKQSLSLTLENGSLLIMKGETQSHWLHALPKMTRTTKPRISLTFRTIAD